MNSTFRLRPLQAAVMLALASASPFSYALRLGEPIVKSYVGQPLVAEFAIEETSPEELRRLQIALANPTLYASMKAAFHPALKTSTLVIVDRASLTPKLVLRTEGPVEDSVVDIVFELSWAAGRMIQSSTVLIDPAPAGVSVEAPAFVASPIVVVEVPIPAVSTPTPKPAPYTNVLEPMGSNTVVVQKGDTLSKIATRMNMSGVKLEQLLIALYNKNSKTIASKNMNLIREGTILALPTKQEALAVDASQALKTVALHSSNFRSYAQNLAQQSGSSTSMEKAPRSQTGSVNSETIERSTGASNKDQVRIGAGREGSTTGSRIDKSAEVQLNKAKEESQSRQREMDKNLKDLESLAKLKNEQLAKIQQRALSTVPTSKPVTAPGAVNKAALTPPPGQNTKPIVVAPVSEPLGIQASVTPPGQNIKPVAPVSEPLGIQALVTPSASPAAAAAPLIKPEISATMPDNKAKLELPKLTVAPSGNAVPVMASPPGSPIVEAPTLPDTIRPGNGPSVVIENKSVPSVVIENKSVPSVVIENKSIAPAVVSVPKEIKPAVAKPAEKSPEAMDYVDEYWPLALGGAGILALLGGWIYTRRKKKNEDAESEYVEEASTNNVEATSFGVAFPSDEHASEGEHEVTNTDNTYVQHVEEVVQQNVDVPVLHTFVEPLDEELEVASYLNDMPDISEVELEVPLELKEPVMDFSAMPYVEPTRIHELSMADMPYVASKESESIQNNLEFDTSNFDLTFNSAENEQLETLTRSLANDMPSLDEPTPLSDTAAYPVSLTYDPDEQLGIAKFYLGLQDYRGVWDMVHPLLNHERDDVKAKAYELLSDIPEDLRAEWTTEK